MELNTKGRYAVMAMTDLAKHAGMRASGSEAMPLSEIAERQHISLPYLEQLFQRLRKAGLVESVRGRTGGYALSAAPETIRIAAILAAVEEPVKMTRCQGGETGCVGHERCLTHDLWSALGDHIAAFLDGITLQDVLDGIPIQRDAASARRRAGTLGMAAE
jgi:Rrf2 family transcriptional regulator, iron-sulfur cluster assembly transcription factor